MSYISYNEYIVLNNLYVLLMTFTLNYLAFHQFVLFKYLLSFKIVQVAEIILTILAVYNIFSIIRRSFDVHLPFGAHLFATGPIIQNLKLIYHFFINESNETYISKPSVITEKPTEFNSEVNPIDRRLLFLFTTTQSSTSNSSQLSAELREFAANRQLQPTEFHKVFYAKRALRNAFLDACYFPTPQTRRIYAQWLENNNHIQQPPC